MGVDQQKPWYLHIGWKRWQIQQLRGDEVLQDDGIPRAIVATNAVLDEIVEIA